MVPACNVCRAPAAPAKRAGGEGSRLWRCARCGFDKCLQCVRDGGRAGTLAYCTDDGELMGFDVGRTALIEHGQGLAPGYRVVSLRGHVGKPRRERAGGPDGGIAETYDWESVGTFGTVIGVFRGQLWVHMDGDLGATPASAEAARKMRVSERGGAVLPMSEEGRRRAVAARDDARAAAAREAAEGLEALMRAGAATFPPPQPRQLTCDLVEPYLRLVKPATIVAVGQRFHPFGQALRRVLEWVLATYGLRLAYRESEADGFRKLAVAAEVFGVPVAVPTQEEYDDHVAALRAAEHVPIAKGAPAFAELCRRRQRVLRARRQVQREERQRAREDRVRKEEGLREDAISRAMDEHRSPLEMRRLQRPRMSTHSVMSRMAAAGYENSAAARRGAARAGAKGDEADGDGAGAKGCAAEAGRPPPLTAPLQADSGDARYLCRGGELRLFATAPEATAAWGVPAGSRVRYTRGDLGAAGHTAVVLGAHAGRLWRYDETDYGAAAQPFAAPDGETLRRMHGVDVVEEAVAVRQCDPFLYLRWDGSVGVFDVSPQACGAFHVYHGQRYACARTPPALVDAEEQRYGGPPPHFDALRKDETLREQPLRPPWVITIVGVQDDVLWYALDDHSGALPYAEPSARSIVEEWGLVLQYTVATVQLGATPGEPEPFRYVGRLRSGLGVRRKGREGDPPPQLALASGRRTPRRRLMAAEVLRSKKRRRPGDRTPRGERPGAGWDDGPGWWAVMVFDTRPEALEARGAPPHGSVVQWQEAAPPNPLLLGKERRRDVKKEEEEQYTRFATIIGVARDAVWAHCGDSHGAVPLRRDALRGCTVAARPTAADELPAHAEWHPLADDDPVGRGRFRLRYLTTAGTVCVFDVSTEVLARFGVQVGDIVRLRRGEGEAQERACVGVRDGVLWACAPPTPSPRGTRPPAEGGAAPLLGARSARELREQFALTIVGRTEITPFTG